jgi:hypothetical protein
MTQPPWPPTYEWTLEQARAYLDGTLDAQAIHDVTSDLFAGYKRERKGEPAGELEDFHAYMWIISQRVLRGVDNESDLRRLMIDLLPDLERGSDADKESAKGNP